MSREQYVVDPSSNTIMKEEQHLFDDKIVIGLAATLATIAILILMSMVGRCRCPLLGKLKGVNVAETVDALQGQAAGRFDAAKKASVKAGKKALKANKKQFKAARKALRKQAGL